MERNPMLKNWKKTMDARNDRDIAANTACAARKSRSRSRLETNHKLRIWDGEKWKARERGKKGIRGSLPEGLAPWRYSLTCVMEALSRPLAPKSATPCRWIPYRNQCCKSVPPFTVKFTAMGSKALDHHTASEEALIELCHSSFSPVPNSSTLGGRWSKDQSRLLELRPWSHASGSCYTIIRLYGHANGSNEIRGPEVYRLFTSPYGDSCECGYLVMGFVPGLCLDAVDMDQHPGLMEPIAASLEYLWQIPIPYDQPGPGP